MGVDRDGLNSTAAPERRSDGLGFASIVPGR